LLRFALIVAALATVIVGIAACGSSGSSSSTGASGASGASGEQGSAAVSNITTTYAKPSGKSNALGATFLKAVDIGNLADILGNTFEIPKPITVTAVNGLDGGPNYNPKDDTITFQYGFAALIYQTLQQSNPDWSQHRLGFATGAVIGFILEHEFTHALINIYNLPVLGKEEDAADALAAVFMTQFVKGGDEFSFDAAKFFDALSERQRNLAPSDYWDEHSLDKQRAYAIVCWVAGASEEDYDAIRKFGILGEDRLQSCPAEYQQRVKSWSTMLKPHLRSSE